MLIPMSIGLTLACRFSARARLSRNTGALVRFENAFSIGELFHQFLNYGQKPLKRLTAVRGVLHRAKAAVSMKALSGVSKNLGLRIRSEWT